MDNTRTGGIVLFLKRICGIRQGIIAMLIFQAVQRAFEPEASRKVYSPQLAHVTWFVEKMISLPVYIVEEYLGKMLLNLLGRQGIKALTK